MMDSMHTPKALDTYGGNGCVAQSVGDAECSDYQAACCPTHWNCIKVRLWSGVYQLCNPALSAFCLPALSSISGAISSSLTPTHPAPAFKPLTYSKAQRKFHPMNPCQRFCEECLKVRGRVTKLHGAFASRLVAIVQEVFTQDQRWLPHHMPNDVPVPKVVKLLFAALYLVKGRGCEAGCGMLAVRVGEGQGVTNRGRGRKGAR